MARLGVFMRYFLNVSHTRNESLINLKSLLRKQKKDHLRDATKMILCCYLLALQQKRTGRWNKSPDDYLSGQVPQAIIQNLSNRDSWIWTNDLTLIRRSLLTYWAISLYRGNWIRTNNLPGQSRTLYRWAIPLNPGRMNRTFVYGTKIHCPTIERCRKKAVTPQMRNIPTWQKLRAFVVLTDFLN